MEENNTVSQHSCCCRDMSYDMMSADEPFTFAPSHDELDRVGLVEVQDTLVPPPVLLGNIGRIIDDCIDQNRVLLSVSMKSAAGQSGICVILEGILW